MVDGILFLQQVPSILITIYNLYNWKEEKGKMKHLLTFNSPASLYFVIMAYELGKRQG